MDSKFRRQCRNLAAAVVKWGLVRFTPFFIPWKRKDLFHLGGEKRDEKSEVGQDGVITNSLAVELQLWKQSNPSALTYLIGNLFREVKVEGLDSEDKSSKIRSLRIPVGFRRFTVIVFWLLPMKKSKQTTRRLIELSEKLRKGEATEDSLQSIIETIEQQEAQLRLLERISDLEKDRRKYKKSDTAETWVSRWIASPIAYLFPRERREEWLGDLYELHREMLHKDYPRWWINLVDLVRTIILIVSAFQIKFSDFFSVGAKKSE
jgi:hypothetical protein